jgi:hypothetical protein
MPDEDIPTVQLDGVPARVMMGSAYGVTSPVRVFAETVYVEAHLQPGQAMSCRTPRSARCMSPAAASRREGERLPEHSMAVFSRAEGVRVTATTKRASPSSAARHWAGGSSSGTSFPAAKNASSRPRRTGRRADFPKVPGDEEEFIPLPG